MRQVMAALAVCTVLGAAETATASPRAAASLSAEQDSGTAIVRHATRCVVKSIDANTLVNTRPINRCDMTFALSPSTQQHGTIAVGTTVSVRYQEDGLKHVATAITARNAKEAAAPEPPQTTNTRSRPDALASYSARSARLNRHSPASVSLTGRSRRAIDVAPTLMVSATCPAAPNSAGPVKQTA